MALVCSRPGLALLAHCYAMTGRARLAPDMHKAKGTVPTRYQPARAGTYLGRYLGGEGEVGAFGRHSRPGTLAQVPPPSIPTYRDTSTVLSMPHCSIHPVGRPVAELSTVFLLKGPLGLGLASTMGVEVPATPKRTCASPPSSSPIGPPATRYSPIWSARYLGFAFFRCFHSHSPVALPSDLPRCTPFFSVLGSLACSRFSPCASPSLVGEDLVLATKS